MPTLRARWFILSIACSAPIAGLLTQSCSNEDAPADSSGDMPGGNAAPSTVGSGGAGNASTGSGGRGAGGSATGGHSTSGNPVGGNATGGNPGNGGTSGS